MMGKNVSINILFSIKIEINLRFYDTIFCPSCAYEVNGFDIQTPKSSPAVDFEFQLL